MPAVDWHRPWLLPLAGVGQSVAQGLASGSVADALNATVATQGCPVRFTAADAAPPGEAYEAFIRRTAQVPTRDNLHDLFNGLVWLRFPQSKAVLNRLQAEAIAAQGVGAVRGPVRDAITLFDENGALLLAPPALWQALLARDWHALFVTHRPLWAQARLVLFGHALMEQLVSPRKNITAHVLVEQLASDGEAVAAVELKLGAPQGLAALDAALAARLSAEWLGGKPFTPLPVLGVPGWWPANDDPGFYRDASVFRPARRGQWPHRQPIDTESPGPVAVAPPSLS
jgi:hypothetical protein